MEFCCGRMVKASEDGEHWSTAIDYGEEYFTGIYWYQWDEPPMVLEEPATGRYVRIYQGPCDGKKVSSFVEVEIIPTTCQKGSLSLEVLGTYSRYGQDYFTFNWGDDCKERFPNFDAYDDRNNADDVAMKLCRKGEEVWSGSVDLNKDRNQSEHRTKG